MHTKFLSNLVEKALTSDCSDLYFPSDLPASPVVQIFTKL